MSQSVYVPFLWVRPNKCGKCEWNENIPCERSNVLFSDAYDMISNYIGCPIGKRGKAYYTASVYPESRDVSLRK